MRQLVFAGFVAIVAVVVGGCATKDSMSSRYAITSEKPDGPSLSKNVILVADNQLNHLYGEPVWMRSQFITKIVSVSIRPVQQDLFGQGILRWALATYGTRYPVIHLGDAGNMGCVGEFEAFVDVMASTGKRPWLMAPGNHDAYLMGNVEGDFHSWEKACERAGGPLTKEMLVEKYLRVLISRYRDFGSAYPDPDGLPATGEWRSQQPRGSAFLRAVAWRIDKSAPHRSYVVQAVDLALPPPPDATESSTPVSAVLLDSSQFASAPILLPSGNAGVNGDLQADQLEVVRKWMALDGKAGAITVLMSHHPFGNLRKDSRHALDELRRKHDVPLYVSAHTHQGQFFVRGGREGWLELNVGSIVDYPIEFRTFSIHDAGASGKLIRSPLFRIPDVWDTLAGNRAPRCDAKWEAKPGDQDFYLTYKDGNDSDPEATQVMLMDTLLHTYVRLIDTVPSAEDNTDWPNLSREGAACCVNDDEIQVRLGEVIETATRKQKIDVLIELGRFDRARKPEASILHRDYRICQALWASKYNKIDRRMPVVNDPYIQFSDTNGGQQ